MRRTASEVIRNLEMRIAKLESRTASTKLYLGDIIVAENNYTGGISFYMVEKTTAKTVSLTQVGEEFVSGDYNSGGTVKPNINRVMGRTERKRLSYDSKGDVSVNMKGYSTRIWDYKPVRTHGAL